MVISGGGTGGHVFPAIAIADTFMKRYPDAQILFVGAKGKMEMVRVPEAGYKIIGLWISGIRRSLSLSNLLFPMKLAASYLRAQTILTGFKPHVVVGTGGYASGPVMMVAAKRKIPSVIQEQNAFAGLTNRKIARHASRICVAYDGMENYFPKDKIVFTGNPVRKDILDLAGKKMAACAFFGLDPNYKIVLVLGGSGGAKTINDSILNGLDELVVRGVQVLWATGKFYYETYKQRLGGRHAEKVKMVEFIREMDLAYAAADVVVSRSGALSISELSIAKKASVFVPSPNVAGDHQTKNAVALVNEHAALMVPDDKARIELTGEVIRLIFDERRLNELRNNISHFAKPGAADEIVDEIEKLIA